jgi:hypothetical protein
VYFLYTRKFTLYVKNNPMIVFGYISLVVSVKTINESFSPLKPDYVCYHLGLQCIKNTQKN